MGQSGTRQIRIDNNATTEPLSEVTEIRKLVDHKDFGNPSSVHTGGDRSREILATARASVARLIGADPSQLIFCSSGTEANNQILRSAVEDRKPKADHHLVTTRVEHPSVLMTCEYLEELGVRVTYLDVDRKGQISLSDLESALSNGASLVSVQWVNNETGIILPVERIGALCHSKGVKFHTDAAQAIGKVSIQVAELPIDALSFTGHKIHGPQGVGGFYVRNASWIRPLIHGGDQEGGKRAGTENMSGIAGLGVAAQMRSDHLESILEGLGALRDHFESIVLSDLSPEASINGDREHRVTNTSNLRFHGLDGQALVLRLAQAGIQCSQTSACKSMREEPSPVLRAMGLTESEAWSSVRFGFSVLNTKEEAEIAANKVVELCKQLRSIQVALGDTR